eukprot:3572653-Rhodomonas_salina.1
MAGPGGPGGPLGPWGFWIPLASQQSLFPSSSPEQPNSAPRSNRQPRLHARDARPLQPRHCSDLRRPAPPTRGELCLSVALSLCLA